MSPFVGGDAALAGLKVLSVVDRKDRPMFALERGVEVVFAVPSDPHARERPHPRRRPGKNASVEGLPVSGSGSDRRRGVAEGLVRHPHGVENDGELARYSDRRLLEAGSLRNPEAPGLQREEAGLPRQNDIAGS